MNILDKHIKYRTFENVYLIFGEEEYFKKKYEKKFIESIVPEKLRMMNFDYFEGKNITVSQIIDATDTMPFMNDYRLVILKNSNLLFEGRKLETEKISDYIENMPKSTILVFIEEKVDKRQKLFKQIKKIGSVNLIGNLNEGQIVSWILDIFRNEGKIISHKEAIYMIRSIGDNMDNLYNEIQKLISYKNDNEKVSIEDIDNICTKSVESKIFELISAMANKNIESAIYIYRNLIFNKTSPFIVLSMISRQFRIILQVKYLNNKNYSISCIAKELSLSGFVVKDALSQSKNFNNKMILNVIDECLETDNKIKTGIIQDELAVELLIIKYSSI